MNELENWTTRSRPKPMVLEGRFTRLEPVAKDKHGDQLFAAATASDSDQRFRYLPEVTPKDPAQFRPWLDHAQFSEDPLFFAVIDKKTNTAEGRQSLMRIDPANGVIETGHIYWGSKISQTPVTTEAFYLFARYIFDELGYRRFEWKCNNENEPSKRAALRFGMTAEGVFRQAAIVKGKNRDTAWFSLLDHEWPILKRAFEKWLAPNNFDQNGQQIHRLQDLREEENG